MAINKKAIGKLAVARIDKTCMLELYNLGAVIMKVQATLSEKCVNDFDL